MSNSNVGPTQPCIQPLESRRFLTAQPLRDAADYNSERLTADEVATLLANAASQAAPRQIIVITDREGVILGAVGTRKLAPGGSSRFDLTFGKAIARARTAAYFASTGEAFTTRTARFIVQDHFPHPVQNTPGGPLYGVEFSTQPFSDIPQANAKDLPAGALPLNISGDPGGIPLFKNGIPVGGIGVAGDGRDVAVRQDLIPLLSDVPKTGQQFYNGTEEHDLDEQVALAGAQGFLANEKITAPRILIDGLALPYTFDQPASGKPVKSLVKLRSQDGLRVITAPAASFSPPFYRATFGGVEGELKNPNPAAVNFGIIDSNDSTSPARKLVAADVEGIIADAVKQSIGIRGGIRLPTGLPARVHVAVVDRDGDVLGVFRMDDGTNFSYDVAVQKARTAAFFSDDTHAFSTRAVGFLAQAFFPPGTNQTGPGPLFKIQNELSTNPANFNGPLRNGITIFPGGIPLYKKGKLVGAVGISGDGVDQDDMIAYAGGQRFAPPKSIRSDFLGEQSIVSFMTARVTQLINEFTLTRKTGRFALRRLNAGLDDIRLPYVKFPRNPEV